MILQGPGVGMLRGAGDPLLDFFLDLEIYQDSTIAKFVLSEQMGKASRFGPTQNSELLENP